MPKTQKPEIPDIRVDDAEAAYHKLEDFARRVMAVPKGEIDKAMEKEREKRRSSNSRSKPRR